MNGNNEYINDLRFAEETQLNLRVFSVLTMKSWMHILAKNPLHSNWSFMLGAFAEFTCLSLSIQSSSLLSGFPDSRHWEQLWQIGDYTDS